MIFITVGTQKPFDRLLKIMDNLSEQHRDVTFVAQTLNTGCNFQYLKTIDYMSSGVFDETISKAELIVSHAGMGTIISGMRQNKPIIVFPRIAKLGEHNNDHQLATAKKLEEKNMIYVAYDADTLKEKIEQFLISPEILPSLYTLGDFASKELINSIKSFINIH